MYESQNISNQTELINDCKRGFKSSKEIFNKISTGNQDACNNCPNFVYSCGLGGCKYTM